MPSSKASKELVVQQGSMMTLAEQAQAIELGATMVASGFFPDVKDKHQAAVKIMIGQELGVPAAMSIMGIHIIPGYNNRPPKVMLSADLEGKLMKRTGYDWRIRTHTAERCVLEWFKDGQPLKDSTGAIQTTEYSIQDAKTAGLVRQGGNWVLHPKDMVFARALTRGRKRFATEATAGVSMVVTTPEDEDTEPMAPDLRAGLHALAKEKGITTREQRLALVSKVRPDLEGEDRTWSREGALTNADARAMLAILEAMPDPNEEDLTPALEASVAATAPPDEEVAEGEVVGSADLSEDSDDTGEPWPDPTDADEPAPQQVVGEAMAEPEQYKELGRLARLLNWETKLQKLVGTLTFGQATDLMGEWQGYADALAAAKAGKPAPAPKSTKEAPQSPAVEKPVHVSPNAGKPVADVKGCAAALPDWVPYAKEVHKTVSQLKELLATEYEVNSLNNVPMDSEAGLRLIELVGTLGQGELQT